VPLILVEELLLDKPAIVHDLYSVLLFQVDERTFGIPMDNFGGIIRMPTQFDNTLRSDVFTGTTVIDGQTTMVLDLLGIALRAFGDEIKVKVKASTKITRIAIAEDDPFFRAQLTAFLTARDLKVVAFPDGLGLKEHLSKPENAREVDAVVTDVEMPRMDGLTLTRWIKGTEHTQHLPCLIITALTNKEVIKLAMSAGASAFIPKMAHQQVLQELTRIESGLDKADSQANKLLFSQKELSKRIVTFTIGEDRFALPMEVLKEVSHMSPSLPVPSFPVWMNSVTAFRGKMVPVIDLRHLFKLSQEAEGTFTQQAIVDFQGTVIALRFDTIGEVLLVSQLVAGEGLSKASRREGELTQYLKGIFQKDNELLSLIDPAALVKLYQQRGQITHREENAA
jgi:chemotaxis signal transduction protein